MNKNGINRIVTFLKENKKVDGDLVLGGYL